MPIFPLTYPQPRALNNPRKTGGCGGYPHCPPPLRILGFLEKDPDSRRAGRAVLGWGCDVDEPQNQNLKHNPRSRRRRRRHRTFGAGGSVPRRQMPRWPMRPITEREHIRFIRKIDISDPGPCWPWIGGRGPRGYGIFFFRGRSRAAHRVAWAMRNGKLPGRAMVMHACDNPGCVNPDHLSRGTAKENAVDAAVKGRLNAKLTADDVREIRAAHEAGHSPWQIHKRYPVSYSTIRAVISRTTWRHVEQ